MRVSVRALGIDAPGDVIVRPSQLTITGVIDVGLGRDHYSSNKRQLGANRTARSANTPQLKRRADASLRQF
jgi:hypothetical protein